jgi:phage gpG-like protein
MAVALSVDVKGIKELERIFARVKPSTNPRWVTRALISAALLVQKVAAEEKIRRGGTGPPVAGILTSRTGTLRRSIAVDRTDVPRSVSVGTHLVYGEVHELGWSGTQNVKAYTRRDGARVKAHSRKMDFPPRPFLKPALEDSVNRITDFFEKELDRELAKR